MAGDWIKVECNTPDKPEVFLIAEILNIDPDAVVGKLIRVWVWADQQTIDGNASGVTKMLLDRISGVSGFTDAMISVGWMVYDQGLIFVNFDVHNGKGAKKRANTARRVLKHRQLTPEEDEKCNAPMVTLALPEKRREEKSISTLVESSSTTIPYDEILASYHNYCPLLPSVRILSKKRKGHLKARWLADKKHQSLAFWDKYFNYASKSKFLTGNPGDGWQANFDFLISEDKFIKVIEGTYHENS